MPPDVDMSGGLRCLEREKKVAHRKGYIFTKKKHSSKAIMATILGTISLISLCAVIYLSYLKAGDIPSKYGLTGLLIVLFSLNGLILGLITVKEKDMFHLFSWLGILLNSLSLLGMGLVLYAGMLR